MRSWPWRAFYRQVGFTMTFSVASLSNMYNSTFTNAHVTGKIWFQVKFFSHTPLVAMPSQPPQPDLYFKLKKCIHIITLERQGANKTTKLHRTFNSIQNWNLNLTLSQWKITLNLVQYSPKIIMHVQKLLFASTSWQLLVAACWALVLEFCKTQELLLRLEI